MIYIRDTLILGSSGLLKKQLFEMEVTCHIVHSFKVYDPMVFNVLVFCSVLFSSLLCC